MAGELSGNMIAELRERGTFDGFSEERMQSLLEGMWNKVEYALKYPRKVAGQPEECSDSKVMQFFFNGSNFNYHFGGSRFHMLPQSYTFSHCLCLNTLLQSLFIGNERDQVPSLRYIIRYDEGSRFVRGRKVLGNMKYLMRSV